MLKDVDVIEGTDAAVLVEHTVQQVNLVVFKEITMNAYAIATGTREP